MTKIICDICGKEMSPIVIIAPSDNFPLRIDTNGKRMDVCMDCQKKEIDHYIKMQWEHPDYSLTDDEPTIIEADEVTI